MGMDFDQIKKLLELGEGKCAIYEDGQPGYVILTAAEFSRITGDHAGPAPVIQPASLAQFASSVPAQSESEFRIQECALDEIKIEDLPL